MLTKLAWYEGACVTFVEEQPLLATSGYHKIILLNAKMVRDQ